MSKVRVISKRPRVTKKSTRWQRAYIAGFIDARAGLTIDPQIFKGGAKVQLHTMVRLYGHNIMVLRMIQERYGGVIKFEDRTEDNFPSRYCLEINDKKDIACLLSDISNYLVAKRRHADLLLKYCESRLKALRSVDSPMQAPITMEEKGIARELIRLNRDHDMAFDMI